jgi:hypothetical protein
MFELNLPAYEFKIRSFSGRQQIFDDLRRKFVALTPEEWVRQCFTRFLIMEKGFPSGRIVHEAGLQINGKRRRCDAVVYDDWLKPLVLIEYKSPDVTISQQVFNQIASYNYVFRVRYLIVSNGLSHYCCRMDSSNGTFDYLHDIPHFSELNR